MPGPFMHMYTARRVADFLASHESFVREQDGPLDELQSMLPAAEAARFAAVMKKWPKYTNLGALGPDLFFFCMDFHQDVFPCDEIMLALRTLYLVDDAKREDYEPFLVILEKYNHTWAGILRFLIKLDKIWQNFVQTWDDTIGRVTNAIGEIIDDLSGGMLTALGDALTQLLDELVALFVQEILTSFDIFSWFALVMQEGVDEQSFLWSDMLHYRKTNLMAANLIKQSALLDDPNDPEKHEQSEQFLAYALGFICHIGTDVVGHSFVNEQCGGPFRTHWQRHHLIENHIDAWLYRQTKPGGTLRPDPECGATDAFPALDQSALYFALQLTPDEPNGDDRPAVLPPVGKTPEEKRARKEALDTDGEMPDWLAKGIVKALIDTYYDPNDPNNIHERPANLQGEVFQKVAVDPVWQPPDPPLDFEVPTGFPLPWEVQVTYRFMLTFFKRQYMDSFDLPKPPHPKIAPFPTIDVSDFAPDFSGVNPTDPPAKQIEDILLALLFWLAKLFEHAAEFAYDAAKSIASAGTYPVREAIYENITLPAWQAVRSVREILVHLGFLMPQDEAFSPGGELLHRSEIDEQLIRLGHTVDGAFRQALADAADPLGNLDRDPSLILDNVRNPQDINYPWLPVYEVSNPKTGDPVRDKTDNSIHFKEYQRPWAYPDKRNDGSANRVEQYRTVPGPFPQHAFPDLMLRTDTVASNPLRWQYEQAQSPHETDCLNEQYVGHGIPVNPPPAINVPPPNTGPLGNPIPFAAYLTGRIGSAAQFLDGEAGFPMLADFNLDADRGYGYLCWGWNCRLPAEAHSSYRGRKFDAPCVWPEAAAAKGADSADLNANRRWSGPDAILQLHYKKQQNPGCDDPNMQSPDRCVPPIG